MIRTEFPVNFCSASTSLMASSAPWNETKQPGWSSRALQPPGSHAAPKARCPCPLAGPQAHIPCQVDYVLSKIDLDCLLSFPTVIQGVRSLSFCVQNLADHVVKTPMRDPRVAYRLRHSCDTCERCELLLAGATPRAMLDIRASHHCGPERCRFRDLRGELTGYMLIPCPGLTAPTGLALVARHWRTVVHSLPVASRR